jgi:hypothetical protein
VEFGSRTVAVPRVGQRALDAEAGLGAIPAWLGFLVPDRFPGWHFPELVELRVLAEPPDQDALLAVDPTPWPPAPEAPGWQACLRTQRFASG